VRQIYAKLKADEDIRGDRNEDDASHGDHHDI
jgi:hypothetical protein